MENDNYNDIQVQLQSMRDEMQIFRQEMHNAFRYVIDKSEKRDRCIELQYGDIMLILDKYLQLIPPPIVTLKTQHGIATSSDDYKFPRGTINDNTRSPGFAASCERIFSRKIKYLDVGCAGGGLVLDFILRGNTAFGLEGSDISLKLQRANWRILQNSLFTCDITEPFSIKSLHDDEIYKFDLITAWEVMEHIPREKLPCLLKNVKSHLDADGFFIGSVATFPDFDKTTGAVWHVTLENRDWWYQKFLDAGFIIAENHGFNYEDFCRGGITDYDVRNHPELGFHFVLKKRVE